MTTGLRSLAALLSLALSCWTLPALADEDQLQSSFAINDADPESSVPSPEEAMHRPLQMGYHIMQLSERADAATARGDHGAAAKYWLAMGKAAPDRALPFSRACRAFEAAGEYDRALQECRDALGKGGVTVDDNLQFVQLLLQKPGNLTQTDIADVEAVASHLKDQLPTANSAGEIQQNLVLCQLGSRLSDVKRLKSCTSRLQELAPTDPQALVFRWSLAMLENDFKRAGAILDSAKQARLAPSALDTMQQALLAARTQHGETPPAASRQSWGLIAALSVLTVGLTFLTLYKRRQRFA